MIPAKRLFRRCKFILLISACSLAYGQAQAEGLTLAVPQCKPASAKVLPDKYLALAKKHKVFAWALKARPDAARTGGAGWEVVDGTGTRNWFSFSRIDINNDGYCDWYLNASTPLSTGGDRDSINTVYLGGPKGWLRIGASIPDNKPDLLGFGKAYAEQARYLFGEEPSFIYDASQKTSYIITAFYSRHQQRDAQPGYRILAWDAAGKTVRVLDKWQPGSKASQVYAYFKKNGAYVAPAPGETPEEAIQTFDQEIEAFELEQACGDLEKAAGPAEEGGVSPHLLSACKRPRAR